jgi:PhoPQ-activated pathogenicity-related protein
MTKAAKRAVDTIEEFVPTVSDLAPTQVMATGYSKRGWTTWLLASVDQRVFAIAPTVFDLLNMHENLHHHHQSLGGWSWAFGPYWNEDVARYLNHPRFDFFKSDIDVIEYNERLTMPKVIIVGGNDQFFPSSGSHYFFDELTGPKFMCLWENDDHGLGDHQDQIDRNLEAFFTAARLGFDFPQVTWERTNDEDGGTIVLSGDEPLTVGGWMLDNTNKTCDAREKCRRDSRFRALNGLTGNHWDAVEVEDLGGSYRLQFGPSDYEDGFRYFFIDMTYAGPEGLEFRFSTEVNVVPDGFPFERCVTEEECHGILV